MKNSYKNIRNYLTFLSQKYNVQICIKDFYGFIPINKELDEALQPFLAHTNPFCMYMKSEQQSYFRCLSMIRKMYEKFEKSSRDYYFGMCHAGLYEYIVPIRHKEFLLGSINAGFFQSNSRLTDWCIRRSCKSSCSLSYETASVLYQNSISPPRISPDELLPQLLLLAEYLSHTYEVLKKTNPDSAVICRYHNSNEDTILAHAIEYIRCNSKQHISMEELSGFCHCSCSHLSHIFKKRIGVNINLYINKVRIELSKSYLIHSNDSIGEIAINTGFNDPNYYSRVFTKIMGISPKEFRRRFQDVPSYKKTSGS